MNLRDLKYIVAVADLRNFNRAAEACFVSQPSLSKQIQKLEEYLGVTIFERTNKKVSVTPIGEKIVERARRTVQEADAIRQIAKESSDPLSGGFRLGIIPTAAPYLLPRILPAMQKQLPKIATSLIEGHTETIVNQLKRSDLDAVLAALPLQDDELEEYPLYSEPFFLATPHNHPLAQKKKIKIEDLAGEQLLLLEDGHCLRAQALQVCRLGGGQQSAEFSATSLETLRQMVAAGSGVTLMPALATGEGPDIVRYVPFKDPQPSRLIGLAWRRSSPRKRLLNKLATIIEKEMKDMPRKGVSTLPIHEPKE